PPQSSWETFGVVCQVRAFWDFEAVELFSPSCIETYASASTVVPALIFFSTVISPLVVVCKSPPPMRYWSVRPCPPRAPWAVSVNDTGHELAPLHWLLDEEIDGRSGVVYGVTALGSSDRLLTPPSSAKPLRASTVNR